MPVATLVARDLIRQLRSGHDPPRRLAGRRPRRPHRRRRSQRDRQDHPAAHPRRPPRARAGHGHRPRRPAPPSATSHQVPERSDDRDGAGRRWSDGPGVAGASAELDAATADLASARSGPTTATSLALEPVAGPGRRRPRRPGRRGVVVRSPSSPACSTRPRRRCSRRRGGPGPAGRRAAVPLRRAPARRAHQRPRLRRPRPAGGLRRRAVVAAGAGQPRPRLPRPHHRRRRRARRAQPVGVPVRGRLGRLPRGAGHGSAPRRGGLRGVLVDPRRPPGPDPAPEAVERRSGSRRPGPRRRPTTSPTSTSSSSEVDGREAGVEGEDLREGPRPARGRRQAVGGVGPAAPPSPPRPGPATWSPGWPTPW